jgi:uncharacterized membrane protein
MTALGQMNPAKGDFIPELAHIEGPLTYYAWYSAISLARVTGIVSKLPHEVAPRDQDYRTMMLIGRGMSALSDAIGIILVFMIVARFTRLTGALVSALAYAILPFEVVYSHYMRPHALGNTLVLLVIWVSSVLEWSSSKRGVFLVGCLCGLAVAVRYNLALVGIIPLVVLVARVFTERWKVARARVFLDGRFLCLGLGALCGLLMGVPGLICGNPAVYSAIRHQASVANRGALSWPGILDLTLPFKYVRDVIPFGTGFLWISFYGATVAATFLRRHRQIVLGLLGFAGAYFFLMSKGYPITAVRTILPLFPVWAILLGLVVGTLLELAGRISPLQRRVLHVALAAGLLAVMLPGFAFSYATVAAMADRSRDPYVTVYEAIARDAPSGPSKIGFVSTNWDWYMVQHFQDHFSVMTNRTVTVLDSKQDYLRGGNVVDFLIIYEADPGNRAPLEKRRDQFLASGRYLLVGVHQNGIRFGRWVFDYTAAPHDFRYPFPRITLLRGKTGAPVRQSAN